MCLLLWGLCNCCYGVIKDWVKYLLALITHRNFPCNSCYGIFTIVSQFSHVIVAITLCSFININSLRWDPTGLLRDGFLEHALKGRAYRAFYFVNIGVSVINIVNSITITNIQMLIKSEWFLGFFHENLQMCISLKCKSIETKARMKALISNFKKFSKIGLQVSPTHVTLTL